MSRLVLKGSRVWGVVRWVFDDALALLLQGDRQTWCGAYDLTGLEVWPDGWMWIVGWDLFGFGPWFLVGRQAFF